ncbi:uncharacterized protein LOC108253871 isoform X1 [Diaphorina citri]|uniref:Uncharacterized protein LOC108253871 isoform X1 n=1 Tax=Diaphorina citri TaxID=121845 RepID=A0A1S4EPU4_DIACI|nr:uncharacterized protein LOC108253871 isoform X2 [Diaphorina citri]XP_026687521.1 uncharacterized protein LOC108253871 isoform X1 [Diaphorina citri]KAI5741619.1 hypothetical protein M8J76_015429 [Diaphorina citri]
MKCHWMSHYWKVFNQIFTRKQSSESGVQGSCRDNASSHNPTCGERKSWKISDKSNPLRKIADNSRLIRKKKDDRKILPKGLDKFDPMYYHPALLSAVQFKEKQGWQLKLKKDKIKVC